MIRKNTTQKILNLPENHQRPVILNGTVTPDSEANDSRLSELFVVNAVKSGIFMAFNAAEYDYGLSRSEFKVHSRISAVDMRIIDFSCFCL